MIVPTHQNNRITPLWSTKDFLSTSLTSYQKLMIILKTKSQAMWRFISSPRLFTIKLKTCNNKLWYSPSKLIKKFKGNQTAPQHGLTSLPSRMELSPFLLKTALSSYPSWQIWSTLLSLMRPAPKVKSPAAAQSGPWSVTFWPFDPMIVCLSS